MEGVDEESQGWGGDIVEEGEKMDDNHARMEVEAETTMKQPEPPMDHDDDNGYYALQILALLRTTTSSKWKYSKRL